MSENLFHHTKQQELCPICGAPLHIRQSKKGLFLGCTAYPKCDYLKPLQGHSEHKILKDLTETCPKCDHFLQVKQGHFGIFIGCSNYPNCHFIVQDGPEVPPEKIPCPECNKGELLPRRGRQGKTFYGCNQYPHCKFTLSQQPQQQICPKCGENWALVKNTGKSDRTFVCINPTCRSEFE